MPAATAPGRFELDRARVGLGYRTRDEQWGARVDQYQTAKPSVSVDYGRLISESIGVGARANYQGDIAETLISGVLAPDRTVRLGISAGELRDYGACTITASCAGGSHSQNSYLLSLKKSLGKESFVSGLGVNAFDVADDAIGTQAMKFLDGERMLGRMRGYALNLTLRPSADSKVDLRSGHSELTYYSRDQQAGREGIAAASIGYTRHFDRCLRFEGRYGTTANAERVDLGLAQGRWNISVSRSGGHEEGDLSVQAGYSIPLGAVRGKQAACGDSGAQAFAPLVESVIRRPRLVPRTPLSAIDGADLADELRGW
jgi:hypothetical protein